MPILSVSLAIMDAMQKAIIESLALAESGRVAWEKLDAALLAENLRRKKVPGPGSTPP